MQSVSQKPAAVPESPMAKTESRSPKRWLRFTFALLLLTALFSKPLYDLFRFALKTDVFSYIVLVPFISAWLIWLKRDSLPAQLPIGKSQSSILARFAGLFCGAVALMALSGFWFAAQRLPALDRLCLSTVAYAFLVIGAGFLFLRVNTMTTLAFPFSFFLFLIPFPSVAVDALEIFFQHASADAAAVLINLSGLPLVRDGLVFHLPGLTIQVAQECSGIRSTLVLFITSLLAGYLFLRSPWKRGVLTLFVIPLAIVRNGLRIFTLAYLTVEMDPGIIRSPLHHRGGPIFFALSLIPFFLLLIWLRKSKKPVSGEGR